MRDEGREELNLREQGLGAWTSGSGGEGAGGLDPWFWGRRGWRPGPPGLGAEGLGAWTPGSGGGGSGGLDHWVWGRRGWGRRTGDLESSASWWQWERAQSPSCRFQG